MEVTIRIPKPTELLRHWKWGLLALLAVIAALTAGPRAEPFGLRLTPQPAEAAFPGLNGKIAFGSDRTSNFEVFVMDGDGTSQTNLSNNAASDFQPVWSPDGTKIAFISNRTGNNEVFVMNADGSGQTNLTNNNAASDGTPAWSPDGTKIAFVSTRTGSFEVFVMNADGSGQTNLTNNAASDSDPVWSPDGTKIAFASDRTGDGEVFVMNADGTGQTNVTNNASSDRFPAWSPDGLKIAFASDRTGSFEVFVMNADGTGPTNLTNNVAFDVEPAWSPDGTKIAFSRQLGSLGEVFVMNADGTGQTNLTNNAAFDFEPDWQPLPPINITNIGQYALPKTCFDVRDDLQNPLFVVCDNDFQGPPAANAICIPDGVCDDEDTAPGQIKVTVAADQYHVVETKPPANHAADSTKYTCDTNFGCTLTSTNAPNNNPWFPWDIDGNGLVDLFIDIFGVAFHFGDTKP